MSFKPRRHGAALAALALMAGLAQAQPAPPAGPVPAAPSAPQAAAAPTQPSAMTAQLLYEVLLGEIAGRTGDPGQGFALLLDAARRSGEADLFKRAAEVAVQGRSPEAALQAARAWQQAVPESKDGRRLELQVLIAMGRLREAVAPLSAELAATPLVERPALLTQLTRLFGRAQDKKLAAEVLEQALADELNNPRMAGVAWTAVGRVRQIGEDLDGALAAAQRGAQADPASDGPVVLAMDLISPQRPEAEALVLRYLARSEALPEARIAYARALAADQRYADAQAQLRIVTDKEPELAEPWLMLGTLQNQMRDDAAAEQSLQRYLALASAQTDGNGLEQRRGLSQAYLQLSQLAERRKDLRAAEEWLARIEGAEELAQAQIRRALLLGRQGKLTEARALLQQMPARTAAERKQRFMAEVQLLRDAKQFEAAHTMLAEGHQADPDDADLLYDLALTAERLGRNEEMEQHLRRVMALQPDNAHAYNALGYSLADRGTRLDEARTLIRKAVELAPEDPFIADSLGWVEFRLGNVAEAARILEAAYKKRPDPEIGAHWGEVLWVQGQRERALQVWKEVALTDADNETLRAALKRLRVSL